MMKRSEQDRGTRVGRGRQQQPPRQSRERSPDQFERDPWRAAPARGRAAGVEPREPAEGYAPFEPGHPREEGSPFSAGPSPRYLGTGFPGRGGPGFTGGYYGFGSGSLEPDWRAGRGAPEQAEPRGRPPRRYPPGPKGYQRSDERLREDISERLMQAHEIDSSEVTVEVSGAKAVVEGTVPQRWMKHAIEDLVDACPGVQDIDNRIRVSR
jgi:hypothetical protein